MTPLWHRAFQNDPADRCSERSVDAIGSVPLQRFDDVRVEIGRRADLRVSEGHADGLEIDAGMERDRRVRVAQAVERRLRDAAARDEPRECLRELVRIPGLATVAIGAIEDPRVLRDRDPELARRDLIDYDHLSPLSKAARNVMPFAAFNTQTPGNVLRTALTNPARIDAMSRASGGTYTGGTYTTEDGRKIRLSLPTAEIGRLDPMSFVRRTVADPIRFSLDASGNTAEGKKHFFENGHNSRDPKAAAKIMINAALAGVPGAREALEQGGIGPYKPRSFVDDLLQGSSGISIGTSR